MLTSSSSSSYAPNDCSAGDGPDGPNGCPVLDRVGGQRSQPGTLVELLIGGAAAQLLA